MLVSAVLIGISGCSSSMKKSETAEVAKEIVTTPPDVAPTGKSEAKSVAGELYSSVSCTQGQETRTVQVLKNGSGCQLEYVRGGQSTFPANAKYGTNFCQQKMEQIKKNLETAGYNCSGS